jgi:ArsR family transcriptional regulator, arsenate/arsenite/antimonite-responsive transcriptional repressor / arsenate reductase (thioredoxin)
MSSTKAIDGFGALAQSTRLTAIRQLLSVHPNTLSAGEIARRCRVPHNTMSTHLGILTRTGLVEVEREGRGMNYRANVQAFEGLIGFLARDCCKGRPDLCGLGSASSWGESGEGRVPIDPVLPAFNVLFLCTHNSARSIMAEALLEKLGNGRFRAYSAGTEPARAPLPDVIERLKLQGHEISRLRCKPWNDFAGTNAPRMDFVVALCEIPREQFSQEIRGQFVTAAWPLPDPAHFSGSKSERAIFLNELYAMIGRRIEAFTSLPFQSLDRKSLQEKLDQIGDAARLTS